MQRVSGRLAARHEGGANRPTRSTAIRFVRGVGAATCWISMPLPA